MRTEAIVFESPNKVGLRSFEIRPLTDHEVLLETQFSTVSPGTELRTLSGKEMQALSFPAIPGYSTVGRVIRVGDWVQGLEVGSLAVLRGGRPLCEGLVSSWGGHARHLIVPEEEVFTIPSDADAQHATLIPLLATTMHGVDLARARIREQVAVVGLGLVGQLSARLLHHAGAHVVATDLIDSRLEIAARAGVRVLRSNGDLRAAFDTVFPYGAEVVLDATGSSKALPASLRLLRERPREDPCGVSDTDGGGAETPGVLERMKKETHLRNGWHGPRLIAQGSYAAPIEINYYDVFMNEAAFIVPRVHELKDMFRAIEMLSEPQFSLDGLISQTVSFREAPGVYQQLQAHPDRQITVCFAWNP